MHFHLEIKEGKLGHVQIACLLWKLQKIICGVGFDNAFPSFGDVNVGAVWTIHLDFYLLLASHILGIQT